MNLGQAARSLNVPKAYLYGILRAYGMEPAAGVRGKGERGKPPRILTRAQMDEIRRRLAEARGAPSASRESAD